MNDFVIYTDSACDIPPELLKEWGVPYSWLTYVFDGDARQYSNYELPFPEFYDKMRLAKGVPSTAAIGAKCVLYTGGHQSRALLEAACPHVIDDLALLPDLLESL